MKDKKTGNREQGTAAEQIAAFIAYIEANNYHCGNDYLVDTPEYKALKGSNLKDATTESKSNLKDATTEDKSNLKDAATKEKGEKQ